MKKTDASKAWLQLSTSSQFDRGVDTSDSPLTDLPVPFKSSSNSIFVESLIDQLCRLIEKDPKEQRKVYNAVCAKLFKLRLIDDTYQSEELSTLRGHYRQALSTFLQTPDVRTPLLETSRYGLEFEEIGYISSGGFGQVFRARNRLDQVEYAVKKIKIRYKDPVLFLRTLTEVKTLARLNHVNIVQYKAAWLEASTTSVPDPVIVEAKETESDESGGIVFQHSDEDEGRDEDSSENNQLAICRFKPHSVSPIQAGATLFVTMQLCDETLRHWLDRRNSGDSTVDLKLVLNIIRQAAAGIAYIHGRNVVHHDIKPSNIFITEDLQVQVGDFGLACTLQGGTCPVGAGQRGTGLYAAPEQLRGQCHQRSDLFSLGLVLLELVTPFVTAMERVDVLNKARTRRFPAELPLQVKKLLVALMETRPDWRPTAEAFLDKLNELNKDNGTINEEDKDNTILELRRQLAEKDSQIQELKKCLSNCNSPPQVS